MGEKIIQDFVRSITTYNSRIKSNPQLRDDYKLLTAYYSSKKAGKQITMGGVNIDLDEILRIAKLIYKEIEDRVANKTMEHDWKSNNMRPAARELFEIIKVDTPEPKEELLTDHICEDIMVIKDAVYLSGDSEICLSLPDNQLTRIMKAQLYKMFPDEIAQKLSITHSASKGDNDALQVPGKYFITFLICWRPVSYEDYDCCIKPRLDP